MTERGGRIREVVLAALCLVYLLYAFRIGYWITGDMHSGGPFVGPALFPLFVASVTMLLFWRKPRTRNICLMIIGAYIAFGAVLFLVIG